jgi:hypothetical protein
LLQFYGSCSLAWGQLRAFQKISLNRSLELVRTYAEFVIFITSIYCCAKCRPEISLLMHA